MKRIILVVAMILVLPIAVLAHGTSPEHGDQHVCSVDPDIVIIYDGNWEQWEWYIPAPDGSNTPFEQPELTWRRLPVQHCPACGCTPNITWCWIWPDDD